jgi:hypothetical protein
LPHFFVLPDLSAFFWRKGKLLNAKAVGAELLRGADERRGHGRRLGVRLEM